MEEERVRRRRGALASIPPATRGAMTRPTPASTGANSWLRQPAPPARPPVLGFP